MVKGTRPDWQVGLVQLGTEPQASPIFTIKPDVVKTSEPDRSNRLTGFFFLKFW